MGSIMSKNTKLIKFMYACIVSNSSHFFILKITSSCTTSSWTWFVSLVFFLVVYILPSVLHTMLLLWWYWKFSSLRKISDAVEIDMIKILPSEEEFSTHLWKGCKMSLQGNFLWKHLWKSLFKTLQINEYIHE